MDNRALGKGLSALIPEKASSPKEEGVAFVKTSLIKDNRNQPRVRYDDQKLQDLMASIKEKGVLQPILVRKSGSEYEVIAGERRLKAARALKLEEVPVVIKTVTDREALVLALVENIQREELNAIEEAQAFKKLVEDFQFSQEDVAQSIGKDRSTVSNLLRLLKLPEEIQTAIFDGKISEGHARSLVGLDDKKKQRQIFDAILKKGLSVRDVERLVKKSAEGPTAKKDRAVKDHDVALLEQDLQKLFGTKVRIIVSKKNKGKLVVEFYSLDDFDRILGIIKK